MNEEETIKYAEDIKSNYVYVKLFYNTIMIFFIMIY